MKSNYTTSLFEMEVDETDFVTGELKKSTKAKVVSKPKTPDFLMLFTAGAPLLRDANLTKSSEKVLSKILEKWVLRKNRVELSTTLINYLMDEFQSSRSTIYTAISLLKEKQILVQDIEGITGDYIKGAWYLNPYIFGKGKWNDISKLRFDLSVEFDFNKLEASSKATRIAEYDENIVDQFNNGEYEILDSKIEHNEQNNVTEAEILVEKNVNKASSKDIHLIEQKKNENINEDKTLELEILKEKNKEKELSIEEMKLKIEIQKLGI